MVASLSVASARFRRHEIIYFAIIQTSILMGPDVYVHRKQHSPSAGTRQESHAPFSTACQLARCKIARRFTIRGPWSANRML